MITPLGSRIRSPFLLICSMVQSSMAKLAFFSFNNRFQASMSVTSKAMCRKPWRFSGTEPFSQEPRKSNNSRKVFSDTLRYTRVQAPMLALETSVKPNNS